ncbi:hypothetical protein HEFE104084_01415 [Helicobacter felis]|uniref:Uncharacterized protein n=1 Tax=Helicobacter felis (strain ATCC 49179 / CCUG 28539 / NCTC 12436 / CS1) TaxID=936155 RepID=E7AAU8_HELFC|nr:unnamed protein product [Helicobacter felis ATCC 49179]
MKTTKKPCVPQDEKKADYYEELCHKNANFPAKIYNHSPMNTTGALIFVAG